MSIFRTKYDAGIYLLTRTHLEIPPETTSSHGDVNCQVDIPMKPISYRLHTHGTGVLVTGYKYNPLTDQMTEFARFNPQWPQVFYPVTNNVTFQQGDYILSRCTYNTTGINETQIIDTHHGKNREMCNMDVIYYLEEGQADQLQCEDEQDPDISQKLPADSDDPLPPNPELELKAKH